MLGDFTSAVCVFQASVSALDYFAHDSFLPGDRCGFIITEFV